MSMLYSTLCKQIFNIHKFEKYVKVKLKAYNQTQRQIKWKTEEEGTEDMNVHKREWAANESRTDVILVIKIH